MLVPAIKKQTSVCLFYFIKSYDISQTQKSGILKKKRKKKSDFIDLAYIADISVLTNLVIYANIVFN